MRRGVPLVAWFCILTSVASPLLSQERTDATTPTRSIPMETSPQPATKNAAPRGSRPALPGAPDAGELPSRYTRKATATSPAPAAAKPAATEEAAPALKPSGYYEQLFKDDPLPEVKKPAATAAKEAPRKPAHAPDATKAAAPVVAQPVGIVSESTGKMIPLKKAPASTAAAQGEWMQLEAPVAEAPPVKATVEPAPAAKLKPAAAPAIKTAVKPTANEQKTIPLTAADPLDETTTPTRGEHSSTVKPANLEESPGTNSKSQLQQVKYPEIRPSGVPRGPAPAPGIQLPGKSLAPAKTITPVAATASASEPNANIPSLSLEWVRRSDINIGQECSLELQVKNSGTHASGPMELEATFPSSVRLTSAEPKPEVATDRLTWRLEAIAPGSEQKIVVKLIPSRKGEIVTSAQLRAVSLATATFRVEEPALKVAVKGPVEVMVGDMAAQLVTVSNTGTGVAHDVKIDVQLPEGLEHSKGERLVMDVGSVNPGESQTVRLALSAVKGGQHELTIHASSSSEAIGSVNTKISVVAPQLKLALDGPGLRYKGRNAKYTVTVTNTGSIPTNNVRVQQAVPESFKFIAADKGGKFDPPRKSVQWFIGRLEPQQTAQLVCELQPQTLGDFALAAQAVSDAGARVDAKTETTIDGIAALVMEIHDVDDPVEVGGETVYEIKIRNEGSKSAAHVGLTCEVPAGLDVLSAKGPNEGLTENRMIVFRPLAEVVPGQLVTYRVHVRGKQEGSYRFRVRLSSSSIQEPIVQEEQTRFYSDIKK